MKLAAAVIIAGTLLSIGFCMETSRKETAKQLQELIINNARGDKRTSKQDGETYGRRRRFFAGVEPCRKRSI